MSKIFKSLSINKFLIGGIEMKKMSVKETKQVKAGWTCWFPYCGAKGTNVGAGLRHAQINYLHGPFMSI